MDSIPGPQARSRDRMSALPVELVHHILSLLPTVDAVRTTILSTRWNKMWTCLTNLDFDRKHFSRQPCDRFTSFVNRVLFSRGSSDIKQLCLTISCLTDFSSIDAWICTAVMRNVVELVLDPFVLVDANLFTQKNTFRMPQSLFMSKTLRVLKLKVGTNLICDPPASACLPSLRFLHLTLHFPNKNSERLFSCCPLVEDIIIDGIIGKNYIFNVSGPQLKTLKISLEERHSLRNTFYINAPKLENLDLNRVGLSKYELMVNAKSLANVSIVCRDLEAGEQPSFLKHATSLLAGIPSVKYLFLSADFLDASYLPAFGSLNQLKLILYDCNYWELLAVLLDRAPRLEDLVLEDRSKGDKEDSELQWNPPEVVPICLTSHLKTISIRGFKALRVEIDVAKYLLKNGQVLNKMTIYTGRLLNKDLHKELFDRAVPCEVDFINMNI